MVLSDLECCQVKYLYITTNASKALGQRPVQTAPLLPGDVLVGLKEEQAS